MAFSFNFLRISSCKICVLNEVVKQSSYLRLGILTFSRPFFIESTKFRKSKNDRIWKEDLPKPGAGHRAFWRTVHYPEKYTVQPLNVTNLAGRDPVTGRVIAKGIGGGIKHKYHWIAWKRVGPKDGPPIEEKVIQIMDDGCRTAKIALVAGEELKYIIATDNMKPGDIIRTSGHIPRIPVRGNEGDAYPLGALSQGTEVCCIEAYPGLGAKMVLAAGSVATIVRHIKDRVILQLPSKHEISVSRECMAVIGRVSNKIHNTIPIGSPNRLRELGYRPRSGLWQRKSGIHGRKIRPLPPVNVFLTPKEEPPQPVVLNMFCNRIW